jgi:hypothetical protein
MQSYGWFGPIFWLNKKIALLLFKEENHVNSRYPHFVLTNVGLEIIVRQQK